MPDRAASETTICELPRVRGGDTGFPVSLVRAEDGRLVVRGVNEGGFSCVDLDLLDLVEWIGTLNPGAVDVDAVARAASNLASRLDAGRHPSGV